jgi:hypothetical protein
VPSTEATPAAAPTPATDASPNKGTLHRALRAIFSGARHPLVLLASGAVISGLLVPTLTRGAQEHEQGLKIKSDLVESMSGAVSPFLAATLANVLAYHGKVPHSYDARKRGLRTLNGSFLLVRRACARAGRKAR